MVRAVLATAVVVAVSSGAMRMASSDVRSGGTIPQRFMAEQCGGANRSPALAWSGEPRSVKSFALIVHDPDAPLAGGFYHWVAYNLPSTMHHLATGAALRTDQLGKTSAGSVGYFGPCPPPGPPHHYIFTLYALDIERIAPPLDGPQLLHRIAGHVLARSVFEAQAQR